MAMERRHRGACAPENERCLPETGVGEGQACAGEADVVACAGEKSSAAMVTGTRRDGCAQGPSGSSVQG